MRMFQHAMFDYHRVWHQMHPKCNILVFSGWWRNWLHCWGDLGSVCISICDLGRGRTIKRSIAAFTKGIYVFCSGWYFRLDELMEWTKEEPGARLSMRPLVVSCSVMCNGICWRSLWLPYNTLSWMNTYYHILPHITTCYHIFHHILTYINIY